jgi:hypothetical protein
MQQCTAGTHSAASYISVLLVEFGLWYTTPQQH